MSDVVHSFPGGWQVVLLPRSGWAHEGWQLDHCFKSREGRELYAEDAATRGMTVFSLRAENGNAMQTLGFAVDDGQVAFELSLPRRVRQETTRALVAEFLTALGLGPWRATCHHGPSGDYEAEFEWGKAGYDKRTAQHHCRVCGRTHQRQTAALTASFTRMLGPAMAAAEREAA